MSKSHVAYVYGLRCPVTNQMQGPTPELPADPAATPPIPARQKAQELAEALALVRSCAESGMSAEDAAAQIRVITYLTHQALGARLEMETGAGKRPP